MNILFYFENQINPQRGGTERVAWLISDYLNKHGHQIFYMARYPVEDVFSKQTIFLPEPGNGENNIRFINQFLIENKIQVVVNEGGNTDDIYLFSHQNIPEKVKIITCLHFDVTGDLDYFCSSYNYSLAGLSWSEQIKKILQIIRLPYLKQLHAKRRKERYRFMYHESDRVVLLCENSIPVFQEFTGLKEISKLIAIVNPNSFSIHRDNFEKENCIIFVGRITFSPKRIDRILKIWKILEPRFTDWKLKMVGDGDYRKTCELFVRQNHLRHVYFEGFTDAEPYYRKAKLLILTSNFEGTPMVIPEAMAYGVVPVVMDSFLGASTHIRNGFNGYLTPPFNIKKTADALSLLMDNEKLRLQVSENGKESIKEFDIKIIGAKWEKLIHTLTN